MNNLVGEDFKDNFKKNFNNHMIKLQKTKLNLNLNNINNSNSNNNQNSNEMVSNRSDLPDQEQGSQTQRQLHKSRSSITLDMNIGANKFKSQENKIKMTTLNMIEDLNTQEKNKVILTSSSSNNVNTEAENKPKVKLIRRNSKTEDGIEEMELENKENINSSMHSHRERKSSRDNSRSKAKKSTKLVFKNNIMNKLEGPDIPKLNGAMSHRNLTLGLKNTIKTNINTNKENHTTLEDEIKKINELDQNPSINNNQQQKELNDLNNQQNMNMNVEFTEIAKSADENSEKQEEINNFIDKLQDLSYKEKDNQLKLNLESINKNSPVNNMSESEENKIGNIQNLISKIKSVTEKQSNSNRHTNELEVNDENKEEEYLPSNTTIEDQLDYTLKPSTSNTVATKPKFHANSVKGSVTQREFQPNPLFEPLTTSLDGFVAIQDMRMTGLQTEDMATQRYLMSPGGNNLLFCSLNRIKNFWGNQTYKLSLGYKDNNKFLLCAQKNTMTSSNYYHISMQEDIQDKSKGQMGKLRSNISGERYTMQSSGDDPKKCVDFKFVREELGGIFQEFMLGNKKCPRKLKVLVPRIANGMRYQVKPETEDKGICALWEKNQTDNIWVFKNKEPRWNDKLNAYVLNFRGRVNQPSIKNFQLSLTGDSKEEVCFQFGKVSDNEFNLDFKYPFSPFQALCVALSSFDYKQYE